MEVIFILFTLVKVVIILYGLGKGSKYFIEGFKNKEDELKFKGLKYTVVSIGAVILVTALEFIIV